MSLAAYTCTSAGLVRIHHSTLLLQTTCRSSGTTSAGLVPIHHSYKQHATTVVPPGRTRLVHWHCQCTRRLHVDTQQCTWCLQTLNTLLAAPERRGCPSAFGEEDNTKRPAFCRAPEVLSALQCVAAGKLHDTQYVTVWN